MFAPRALLSTLWIFTAVSISAQIRIVSPEVTADGRITFRLLAPKATEVQVRGDWATGRTPLSKDDLGLWTGTVGPVPPERYSYWFEIDGTSVNDPRNPSYKGGVSGVNSVVTVPGNPAQPWELRDIPHGAVTTHWYNSKATGNIRRVVVYTPPGYDPLATRRYPVLYLLHGSGDTEQEWWQHGNANLIADSLIAEGKAKPLLIVMPFGHIAGAGASQNTRKLFNDDLLGDIMPLVEKQYRTGNRPASRALAGLSMGGGQTMQLGLDNLDRFAWLGVFSAGMRDDTFVAQHADFFQDAKSTNAKLKLLWIAIGDKDQGLPAAKRFAATLEEHGIRHEYHESAGGHTWMNWRDYLVQFLPLLFTSDPDKK